MTKKYCNKHDFLLEYFLRLNNWMWNCWDKAYAFVILIAVGKLCFTEPVPACTPASDGRGASRAEPAWCAPKLLAFQVNYLFVFKGYSYSFK